MFFIVKRVVDVFGSLFLLILFSPLCLGVIIAIYLDSAGPLFADTPQRVGKKGKLFKLYKFRSMIVNAHKLLRSDPELKNAF